MPTFRTNVWDPALIIGQIFALQSIFYFSECLLLFSYSFVSNYRPSIDHIFITQTIRPITVVQLLSALIAAYALSHIVQRAKQCLDFSTTLHVIHVIIVSIYTRTIPTSITWWLLQIVSGIICTVLGEYLCMKKESMEIPLTVPYQRTESSEA
jgi:hypothetical protein|uniref:Protein SYS1 homolog n=1 Tax=Panagrolaimus sp. PS1159 TaxID=55785 RepID=A0AC35EZ79_9BILA